MSRAVRVRREGSHPERNLPPGHRRPRDPCGRRPHRADGTWPRRRRADPVGSSADADHQRCRVSTPRLAVAPRMLTALGWIVRNRGRFDVIYVTGLGPVAVAGGRCTRLPVVLKIVGDPAWERSVRRGLTDEDFDRFQVTSDGGLVVRAMREIRNWSARDATRVITPSPHLADVVKRWADRDDVAVIPNGVRSFTFSARDGSRGSGLQLVFVGRLVGHKNVDVLIEAVARTPASRLVVIGDGPEFGVLTKLVEQLGATERIVLTGALPHAAAMEQLALGDAARSRQWVRGTSPRRAGGTRRRRTRHHGGDAWTRRGHHPRRRRRGRGERNTLCIQRGLRTSRRRPDVDRPIACRSNEHRSSMVTDSMRRSARGVAPRGRGSFGAGTGGAHVTVYWYGNSAKHRAIRDLVLNRGSSPVLVFDYGCGDGGEWPRILREHPNIELVGYEPDASRARMPRTGCAVLAPMCRAETSHRETRSVPMSS